MQAQGGEAAPSPKVDAQEPRARADSATFPLLRAWGCRGTQGPNVSAS